MKPNVMTLVVLDWKPGTDPADTHYEPPFLPQGKLDLELAWYTGREGIITGFEGTFLYFKHPRGVFAQPRSGELIRAKKGKS